MPVTNLSEYDVWLLSTSRTETEVFQ